MKRRNDLLLRSLGSEYPDDPDSGSLIKWMAEQTGTRCDLISYKLENSLIAQKKIDIPCTGGVYYSTRILESIGGLKSGGLTSEPYPVLEDISNDARRVRKIRKDCYVALPAPSSLGITDYYYNNNRDFIPAICEVYRRLMREQRDRGVKGHVLISDRFSGVELEELAGSKSFFFSPSGGSKVISSILEFQNKIAVFPGKLDVLFEIMPEYEVKSVTIIDPEAKDYEKLLTEFDPKSVSTGGYCRRCPPDYWERLKERSFVIV